MDSFDLYIKDVLSVEIHESSNFDYIIENALYSNKVKLYQLMRTLITTILTIILGSGVVFASYITYEKVWKNPIKYNSYEEKIIGDKEEIEINRQKDSEVDNISEDSIKEASTEFLNHFGYTYSNELHISLKESYSASTSLYYEVKSQDSNSDSFELNYDAKNGELNYFIDKDSDNQYNINFDQIGQDEAIKIGEDIKSFFKYYDNYQLKEANEIDSINGSSSRKEWNLKFLLYEDGLLNDYQRLEIRFYKSNGKVRITQIALYNEGYIYDNNPLEIDEDIAINIARTKDREISELEIKSIKSELSIKPINSFIYLQENSDGKDDGIINEPYNNGENITYYQYSNEKRLRKVWNVKVKYNFIFNPNEPVHNWKEQFGREYYIDATTGEIIGGNWGDSIYE